jgi:hypothetical protein
MPPASTHADRSSKSACYTPQNSPGSKHSTGRVLI